MNYKPKRSTWTKIKRWIWGSYGSGGLCGLYHYIRCRWFNKYHIINIHKGMGYYGWVETDEALLLACFVLLKDFVEQQDPQVGLRTIECYLSNGDIHDESNEYMRPAIEEQVARERQVRVLYDWWTKERPAEWLKNEKLLDKPGGGLRWHTIQEKLHDKDDQMLIKLIKIRRGLWT